MPGQIHVLHSEAGAASSAVLIRVEAWVPLYVFQHQFSIAKALAMLNKLDMRPWDLLRQCYSLCGGSEAVRISDCNDSSVIDGGVAV